MACWSDREREREGERGRAERGGEQLARREVRVRPQARGGSNMDFSLPATCISLWFELVEAQKILVNEDRLGVRARPQESNGSLLQHIFHQVGVKFFQVGYQCQTARVSANTNSWLWPWCELQIGSESASVGFWELATLLLRIAVLLMVGEPKNWAVVQRWWLASEQSELYHPASPMVQPLHQCLLGKFLIWNFVLKKVSVGCTDRCCKHFCEFCFQNSSPVFKSVTS